MIFLERPRSINFVIESVHRIVSGPQRPRPTLALVLLMGLSGCLPPMGANAGPNLPDSAIVDMRNVNFAGGDAFDIPARWEFYWERFLDPDASARAGAQPDAIVRGMEPWSSVVMNGTPLPEYGYASYRMLLRLPPGQYGFRLPHQYTAVTLFVDGDMMASTGQPGETAETSIPSRGLRTFYHTATKPETELLLHVSNFHMFRGGLRARLQVGEAEALARYDFRRKAAEVAIFGFLIAVIVYHVVFYFTQARQSSFLIFAILCLTFAARFPFMGENTIDLLYGELSWEFELRYMTTLNMISPSLVMIFMRSVFPDSVSKRSVTIYSVLCALFLCAHFLGPGALAPAVFALALTVLGPVLIHAAYITVRMALRGHESAIIMACGLLAFIVLVSIAVLRNWQAAASSDFAVLGFAMFSLFQSIALGRAYRESLEARDRLQVRLNQSREALRLQRKELEINLHDSLGGALTDLKIMTERGLDQVRSEAGFSVREHLEYFSERLRQTNLAFRGHLLFMEDMELASRDPLTGLHMMLLRRYSDAGRELDLAVAKSGASVLHDAMLDDTWRFEFMQLAREICTNDLKYGAGESSWEISCREDRNSSLPMIILNQRNKIRTDSDSPNEYSGERARRAAERAARLGGALSVRISGDEYVVQAHVLSASPLEKVSSPVPPESPA